MRQLIINKNDSILIIAPHPDDECIGPGGVLLEHASQCDVLVLTDGRHGQGTLSSQKTKGIRKKEFETEMERLQVHSFRMLKIADGELLYHLDCLLNVELDKYSMIFTTGEQDSHPDHKAAFLSLKRAKIFNKISNNTQIYVYEVHTPLQNPTHFYDITDLLQRKIQLVTFHQSQLIEMPYDLLVQENASYRAVLHRMPRRKIEVYEEIVFDDKEQDAMLAISYSLQRERLNVWLLRQWVEILVNGENISNVFRIQGIEEIYIYGMGALGKLLIAELIHEKVVEIKAVIDRRGSQLSCEGIHVMELNNVDSIDRTIPVVITVISEYEDIKRNLNGFGITKIYSLKSIIEGIKENDEK